MLKERVESLFGEMDQMMIDMYKVSGINPVDIMSQMDKETGSILISTFKIYKDSKELSLEIADMMDEQKLQMECLVRLNEDLLKEVKDLQKKQEMLIDKIEKMEQGNTCKCNKEK